jgi:hypothetical protein
MILKYFKFNEEVNNEISYGDRVITHGKLKHWNEFGEYFINIDNQTGIIADVKRGAFKIYGVVFDDYFYAKLTDLDKVLKFKRGLWVGQDQLELIEERDYRSDKPLSYSMDAKNLLEFCEYINRPVYLNIDYINITDKNDTISYITKDRLDRLGANDDQWDNNLRQEMRIGRFLQFLNPYSNQATVEKKVNLYKAAYNGIIDKKSEFRIVSGDEIYHWYDERSYQEGVGTLNKSCMRDKLERLSLYTNNPDKVSLLILVNDENKLVGRALIWNVDYPKLTYMDRTYTVYQEDVHRFEEYARQQGWKYYELTRNTPMRVFFKRRFDAPEESPYMDTFIAAYDNGEYGENYLSNKFEEDSDYYIFDVF